MISRSCRILARSGWLKGSVRNGLNDEFKDERMETKSDWLELSCSPGIYIGTRVAYASGKHHVPVHNRSL